MPPPPHVLILGGGIAGPALGLALAKNDISSTIFEIRRPGTDQGGSITLAPHALRVIDKSLGVYDEVLARGFRYDRLAAYNDEGYRFGEIQVGEMREEGYPAVRILRSELHRVLVQNYEKSGGEMVWGAKLREIKENEMGVEIDFEDGSTASGDVLIGADGIHSRIRTHILGPHAPTPIYAGTCTINAFSARSEIDFPPEFQIPAMIFTPVGMLMILPVDPEGKTIAWGMTEQSEDKGSRASWRDYARSPKVKESVRLDHSSVQTQPIRGLVDRMDEHDIKVWPHYRIPELETWFTDRTCLIGDAAHAMPPNGQGIAVALEDSAFMARLLSYRPTQSPSPSQPSSAFSTYTPQFTLFQTKRQSRLAQILASSKLRTQATSKSGPWAWALKQWIFSALFWWKGGVMRPGWVGDYDVEMEDVRWE